uniref:HDC08341 n=1 Tax=Drosophila melanogaster TaxID=7227 RepID=Q6ILT9_DROME|nr:TPA_inf: HDC08341 [Drosophila melanogaster]
MPKCETHFGFKLLMVIVAAANATAAVAAADVLELINTPITCDSFRFASDTCSHPLRQDLIAPHPVTLTARVPFPQPASHRTLNPTQPEPKPPLKPFCTKAFLLAGFGILCFLCKTERFLSVSVANSGIASFILAKEIPLSLVLRPPVACHAVVAGIYIQHPESPPPPRTNPSILLHLHLHQHLHRLRRYSFRPSSFVLFVAVWASLSCCQVALKVSLRRIAALSLLHQQLQLHPHPHPLLLLRLQLQLKLKAKPKLYSEGIKCKYPCPGCTCAASSSSSPPPAAPHPIPLLRHRMLPVGN